MEPALIYCRVSADRAAGRSVAEQEAEARAECDRNGWSVAEVVTDSVGASRHSKGKRAGWARAQEIVRSGKVAVLVTWEASRAQRDLEAYADLRRLCVEAGVRWSYSGRTYDLTVSDDRFRTGLDALLAEREADEIAQRVQRAIRANAAAGRPHGRRLFGYQRVYDPTTGALDTQKPDTYEASVVVRVFRRYLTGVGVRTIARELNDDGIGTSTGKQWTDAQVRRILINPAYAGQRVHQGEVVGPATWPALIDSEVFDQVQARLDAQRTSGTRQVRTANLLTGVARCGVCGGKMKRGHDREKRKTYVCGVKFCVGRDLGKLDLYITSRLLERLATVEAKPTGDGGAAERAVINACRERIASATQQFLADELTAATLATIEQDQLAIIRETEASLRRRAFPIVVDVPDPTRIAAWWDSLEPEQRRAVVGAFVAAVTVYRTKSGKGPLNTDAIAIEWR